MTVKNHCLAILPFSVLVRNWENQIVNFLWTDTRMSAVISIIKNRECQELFLSSDLSRCSIAYSQHWITSWLKEISCCTASFSSFSISVSGIRIVLLEEVGFLISNNAVTPCVLFYTTILHQNITLKYNQNNA